MIRRGGGGGIRETEKKKKEGRRRVGNGGNRGKLRDVAVITSVTTRRKGSEASSIICACTVAPETNVTLQTL